MYKFKFVDLLCGIGGFHQAMASLGGECVFACDIDESCRDTYFMNYGIMPKGDIAKVASSEIPSHDFLCAGFPCQPFSKAGNRMGFKDSIKGTPFLDILRILAYHQPKYALLENVRNSSFRRTDSINRPMGRVYPKDRMHKTSWVPYMD